MEMRRWRMVLQVETKDIGVYFEDFGGVLLDWWCGRVLR